MVDCGRSKKKIVEIGPDQKVALRARYRDEIVQDFGVRKRDKDSRK